MANQPYNGSRGPGNQGQRPQGQGQPRSAAGQRPPAGRPPQKKKRMRSENRWFRAIIMVLATVVGCVFLALFLLGSAYDMFGLNQPDMLIEVTIPEDAKISEISKILKDKGVVSQPLTFRLYLGYKVKDEPLKGGDYVFNSNLSYNEMIIALRSGYTEREEVRITFPEGLTLWEIAAKLEENKVCSAQAFVDYLNNDAEYPYEFFGAIEDDPLRYHKLEGYIFPDTYDFYIGENVSNVARKFIKNFNDKMTPDLLDRMQDLNLTIDQTITLASVIQKEAGESDDMRLVSSVFHNRLNDSGNFPSLESDVTIFYVEENIKPYVQLANQRMYDAYNTYVREGLPVGPISNPGMDAINAALYPEETETKFYFFVTDKNMEFYYAGTMADHLKNIEIAKAAGGEAHGIGTQ